MTGNQVPATFLPQGVSQRHLATLLQVLNLLFLFRDGDPCIGAVPGIAGLFMAAGHSCWGILQVPFLLHSLKKLLSIEKGPATGEALAQLILYGKADTVDITSFDPARSVCLSSAFSMYIWPSWNPNN